MVFENTNVKVLGMSTEDERAKARARYHANKEHVKAQQREYQVRNADKIRETRQRYYQANKHKWRRGYHANATGFCEDVVERLRKAQGNKCAICSVEFESRAKIAADHCHKSKTPRGLLCHRCNLIEGQVAKTGLSYEEFGARLAHYISDPPFNKLD